MTFLPFSFGLLTSKLRVTLFGLDLQIEHQKSDVTSCVRSWGPDLQSSVQ